MITAFGFADKFVELRRPSRRREPCCILMSPKAEESNLLAKVFSKNSNLSYYNTVLCYGDSLSNYAGESYCNTLNFVDWCIVTEAKAFIDIIDCRYKYFICHKNSVGHCFLLP